MNRRGKKYFGFAIFGLILTVIAMVGCDKSDDGPMDAGFNKKELLSNYSANLIIPHYQEYQKNINALIAAIDEFQNNPNSINLSQVRTDFKQCYTAWQYVSVYEIGPAADNILRANTNTFPTDTALVLNNVRSQNYNLGFPANIAAKGLPAIDFMLFRPNLAEQAQVDYLKSPESKKYLNDVVAELKANIDKVVADWDGYQNTFNNADGNSVGSSLGLLVNQLNFDFELLKNYQIGVPLGKRTLGNALPEKCEAVYSGISAELAKARLKSQIELYYGIAKNGTDGLGLHDYLIHLKSSYGQGLLADAIANQLNMAKDKLALVPDPLYNTIVNNPSAVNTAYAELQKQVVLFKTDMPSALGILITYQDNDGD